MKTFLFSIYFFSSLFQTIKSSSLNINVVLLGPIHSKLRNIIKYFDAMT